MAIPTGRPNAEQESRLEDEAARWYVLRQTGQPTRRDQEQFAEWIKQSPEHERIYGEFDKDFRLADNTKAIRSAKKRSSNRSVYYAAAAFLIVTLVSAVAFLQRDNASSLSQLTQVKEPEVFQTEIGQSKKVQLGDGSIIEMDSDSVVEVNFSADKRAVKLVRGQAYFIVAHDTLRPFVVSARNGATTAVGTEFNVRLEESSVHVMDTAGKIEVSTTGTTALSTLTPGESIRYGRDGAHTAVERTNIDVVAGWRRGELHFVNSPLSEVVHQLQRYHKTRISLASVELGSMTVTTQMSAKDLDLFFKNLQVALPVNVELKNGEVLINKRVETK